MSFHWKDTARDELETTAPDDKRELMVHLFYPADTNANGERAVYVPDTDVMRGPWNDEQIARIRAMRAFSQENAKMPDGDTKYAVLVFAPGGGMKALTYHMLLEDLASHGWVVAAIDPPYNARGVRFPDGRVLGNLSPEQRAWPQPKSAEEFQRQYKQRIVHWSHDVSFVIDRLEQLNCEEGPFCQRLDVERGVGVFGHSRGGQAAGMVRQLDQRVRSGVNLDGTAGPYVILPLKGDDAVGTQPFLWIQASIPAPPSDERLQRAGRTRADYDAQVEQIIANWHRQLGEVTGGAMRVYIDRPGITHIDFSDEPFWDGALTDETRSGKLQTIADTRTWVRAFFGGTVRGEFAELEQLASEANKSQSEVTVHRFGKMSP